MIPSISAASVCVVFYLEFLLKIVGLKPKFLRDGGNVYFYARLATPSLVCATTGSDKFQRLRLLIVVS